MHEETLVRFALAASSVNEMDSLFLLRWCYFKLVITDFATEASCLNDRVIRVTFTSVIYGLRESH